MILAERPGRQQHGRAGGHAIVTMMIVLPLIVGKGLLPR